MNKELAQEVSRIENALFNFRNKPEHHAEDSFALGAQIMYLGQRLTDLSGHTLNPVTTEGKVLLHNIVKLLEMPTIEVIGQHVTEPAGE